MCYFLCCCKGDDDEDKDNEINLFKLDEKSLEQLEKTEIEHTGRVQNNFISSSLNFRSFWNGLDLVTGPTPLRTSCHESPGDSILESWNY